GSVSMRMLIKSINNLVVEEKHFVLPYRIVERDSCK
ncbi:MAG: LacI family transcriptional regulator, partial [Clostridium sp.]